jgi:hypothetical protein
MHESETDGGSHFIDDEEGGSYEGTYEEEEEELEEDEEDEANQTAQDEARTPTSLSQEGFNDEQNYSNNVSVLIEEEVNRQRQDFDQQEQFKYL